MGWIGKVVGGTLGAIMGGPLGAVIGAGLGHGVDSLADGVSAARGAAPPERGADLDVNGRVEDDVVGIAGYFLIRSPIPPGALGLVRLLDADGSPMAGRAPFADEHGRFLATGPVVDGFCRVYCPYGAIVYQGSGEVTLHLSILGRGAFSSTVQLLGTAEFDISLPVTDYDRFDRVEWLSPLIALSMAVVHADQKVLPEEVRLVRTYFLEVFELETDDLTALKAAMKRPPPGDLGKVVRDVFLRLPNLTLPDVLTVLSDIAKCDGEVHPSEVEIIRQAAAAMGLDERAWNGLAPELGLGSTERPRLRASSSDMSLAEAREVLGVSEGASRAEIQAAYRKLVSDYHPDRVATLPKEFQDLAHEKMTRINAAYEAIGKGR